jgi:sulfur carrier protein
MEQRISRLSLELKINGQTRSVPGVADSLALGEVLDALAVRQDLIAVALNDLIVPRVQWGYTFVRGNDRVEIVHFVGGGCNKMWLASDDKRQRSSR